MAAAAAAAAGSSNSSDSRWETSSKPFTFAQFDLTNAYFCSFLLNRELACLARTETALFYRSQPTMRERGHIYWLTMGILQNGEHFQWIQGKIDRPVRIAEDLIVFVQGIGTWPFPCIDGILVQRTSEGTHIYIRFAKIPAESDKNFYLAYDLHTKKITMLAEMPAKQAKQIQKTDQLIANCIATQIPGAKGWGQDQLISECRNRGLLLSTSCMFPKSLNGFVTSPWCLQGDCLSFIDNNPGLSPHEKLRIATDMAYPILQMHRVGLVHWDIKPDNYLMRVDDQHTAYKIDFATCNRAGTRVKQDEGTVSFFSYERAANLLDGKPSTMTLASDVYSLGVSFYVLYAGLVPKFFTYEEAGEIAHQIVSLAADPEKLKTTFPNPSSSPIPDAIYKLIMDMLSVDPDKRPSISKVYSTLLKLR